VQVQWQAVYRLGQRMAQRNNLILFAWLCAIVLPAVLQLIAGLNEDVRSFLDTYYGLPSLYIFFVMCYGFATIFVSYYQANGYRKAGTLDLLRAANFSPLAVLAGAFLQLQTVLVAPLLTFVAVVGIYAALDPQARSPFGRVTVGDLLVFAVLQLLVQAVLASIPLASLFRRGELVALLSMLLVMPLNALPVLTLRFNAVHVLAGILLLLLILLLLAYNNLRVLWPAQRRPVEQT
jgi:hypothetical protein